MTDGFEVPPYIFLLYLLPQIIITTELMLTSVPQVLRE